MIIIDAGHGGRDPGALGNGLKESILTLYIAEVMKMLCDIYQIPCRMTRTKAEYVSLQQRTNFINSIAKDWPEAVCFSIHINSAQSNTAKGFEIIKQIKDSSSIPYDILKSIENSQILSTRKVFTRANNQGKDYFHILRETKCPTYILEYGFIKNKNDMDSLLAPSNTWVAATIPIVAYLKKK